MVSVLSALGRRPCCAVPPRCSRVLLRTLLSPSAGRRARRLAGLEATALAGELAEPASRDRTAEASTSTPTSSPSIASPGADRAAIRKANRSPPVLIKPGPLDDLSLLQNGVILVDKPLGWTSFDVCGKIRNMIRFLEIKKVGHAGTLDPHASGLLIVCTGRATKFADDFMAQDKEYSGTLRLGEGTASYDAESEVSERAPWEHVTDSDLQAAVASFTGDLMQVPPMFSAIKVGGQKMYQLAREGQSLELPPRPVTITSLRLWRSEANPQDVHFYVCCSKGTYIRSLAHDLGRHLGSCAHLVALRREASGAYRVGDAWAMADLIAEINGRREAFRAQAAAAEADAKAEAEEAAGTEAAEAVAAAGGAA